MRILHALFALSATVVFFMEAVPASAEPGDWVREFGTTSFDNGLAIATDASGAYVVGSVEGVLPGQSPSNTSGGATDSFIRKVDLSGNELWTHQFGVLDHDFAHGVTVDDSGVYVVGWVESGAFPGNTNSGGFYDAYVRKYSTDGTLFWTRQFGDSRGGTLAYDVVSSGDGVYVVGTTSGVLPGQTQGQPPGGYTNDAYVRKYDRNGSEMWTRQFGAALNDFAWGVAGDAAGVYIAGSSEPLSGQAAVNGADGWVRKYSPLGVLVWTRDIITPGLDRAYRVASNGTDVYVAGIVQGALPGQTYASPPGTSDAFVQRYDINGAEIWTREFGTQAAVSAEGLAIDASNVYVVGSTRGELICTPNAGGSDIFARRYDSSGNVLWTRQFGTPGDDYARDAAWGPSGLYVAGDSGGALAAQPNAGASDVVVARLASGSSPCGTNQAPFAEAGVAATVSEGTPLPLAGSAGDFDAATVSTAWSYAPGADVDSGATCTFSAADALSTTLVCNDDGSYTATLTVSDGVNPPVSDSASVTVLNAPPVLSPIVGASDGQVFTLNASSVSVSGAFTDPGTHDTHTCRFTWGDGTSDAVSQLPASGSGICVASHTFGSAGTYTFALSVSDDDGAAVSETLGIVVSDPASVPLKLLSQPQRLLDTRTNGGPIAGGASRCFAVAGLDGIPADADGALLNVTAVGQTTNGWVTAYPSGQAVPTTSTLNFSTFQYAVANNTVMRLGSNGQLCVSVGTVGSVTGSAQVLVDVSGYLTSAALTAMPMLTSPQRLVDTRNSGGPIATGASRCFTAAGSSGIPSDAAAVVLNVTSVGYPTRGWLTAYPAGQAVPATSTLNFDTTEYAMANGTLVRLGTGGQVCVSVDTLNNAAGSAHVILDVTGYVTNAGLAHLPMLTSPQRIVDTRATGGQIATGTSRCFSVAGLAGVPSNATGVFVNVTTSGYATEGWLSTYPGGQAAPASSTVNFDATEYAIANGAVIKLGNGGQVCVNVGTMNSTPGGSQVILDVIGYVL